MRRARLGWLLAGVLIGGGCGESPKGADPATPSVASTATQAPAPSAAPQTEAPKPLPEQLVGAWQVDLDYIKTDAEMLALPPDKREKALAMAQQLLKDLRIIFGADKTLRVGMGENMSKGTYRAWVTAPDTVAVEARMTTTNGAEEDETLSVKLIDGRALITGKDGKATRFMRAAAPTP